MESGNNEQPIAGDVVSDEQFHVGDVVQLKSGGPLMTVTGYSSHLVGVVNVSWFDVTDKLRLSYFSVNVLNKRTKEMTTASLKAYLNNMTPTKEQLQNYLAQLKGGDHQDNHLFYRMILEGRALLGLSDEDFAGELGMDVSSVGRWIALAGAPHPAMRPHVYTYLIEQVQAKMKEIE